MGQLLHFIKRKLAWPSNCEVISILNLRLSFNTTLQSICMGSIGAQGKAVGLSIPQERK